MVVVVSIVFCNICFDTLIPQRVEYVFKNQRQFVFDIFAPLKFKLQVVFTEF